MENTSLIALSRQAALRRQMDVVAHNIANMNTTAYKGEKMMFVQHLVKNRGGEGLLNEKLAFVRDIATMRDTTEGPLRHTGNPLDLAVRGNSYFVVETEGGERYTRNGHFRLDGTGQLVTEHDNPVLSDSDQPFFFSPEDSEITVSRDGTISTENGILGKLKVVQFENEQLLRATFGGMYTSGGQAEPAENPNVVQGMLEGSNVEPVIEMTRMMEVHRSYDAVRKMIERENERIERVNRQLLEVTQ